MYNEPQEAWEVDTYDDGDELDTLVHHMEHELFSELVGKIGLDAVGIAFFWPNV